VGPTCRREKKGKGKRKESRERGAAGWFSFWADSVPLGLLIFFLLSTFSFFCFLISSLDFAY
jgi:hypothetical protein